MSTFVNKSFIHEMKQISSWYSFHWKISKIQNNFKTYFPQIATAVIRFLPKITKNKTSRCHNKRISSGSKIEPKYLSSQKKKSRKPSSFSPKEAVVERLSPYRRSKLPPTRAAAVRTSARLYFSSLTIICVCVQCPFTRPSRPVRIQGQPSLLASLALESLVLQGASASR